MDFSAASLHCQDTDLISVSKPNHTKNIQGPYNILTMDYYSNPRPSMDSAYQLDNIRFRYGEKVALSLPSLTVQPKQVTALIGENGSGKSTLLNVLGFLATPETGKIQFFGQTVNKRKHLEFRRRIGFLAQKPYMLRGTVLDNITIALKMHGISGPSRIQKAKSAMERLGISHCANQEAKKISGGELQKAALARILALEPEVLILDEPFGYLDQTSAHLLESFIESFAEDSGKTLVFSTHNRLQGLALADNVISLVNGKTVKTPLINLFKGNIHNHTFDTGKIEIMLTGKTHVGSHISIDPHEIVISRQPLDSSIRNSYCGRITVIAEEMGAVRIGIDAGERFQALITDEALKALHLHLGDLAWVNFKSNSVTVF